MEMAKSRKIPVHVERDWPMVDRIADQDVCMQRCSFFTSQA
jgi:hypothetical protein